MRSDPVEFKKELQWASSRPGSRRDTTLYADGDFTGDDDDDDPINHADVWESCLGQWEYDAYTTYLHQHPDSVYSLNQNPNQRATYAKDGVPRLIHHHCQFCFVKPLCAT